MSQGIVHKAGIRAFALVILCTSIQYLIGWYAVVNSVPRNTAHLHQVYIFDKIYRYLNSNNI